MKFKSIEEFQNEVNKIPPDDAYVNEHGIIWLKQSYAINRMNEVFGEGYWNIEKIQKSEVRNKKNQFFGNSCVLAVSFKHPVTGDIIQREGVSGIDGELDNNIIGRAFLNAIASIGKTFGRDLMDQFE
jgi:hypothetical protein